MHRTAATVFAILILAASVLAAGGDPAPRTPLTLDAPVNALAMSSSGGILAVALDDPGSRVPTPGQVQADPRHDTWLLYFPDGRSIRQSGDVDPADCDTPLPSDDCQTDATHLVVDRSGNRLVAAGSLSPSSSTVVFATASAGEIAQSTVVGAVRGLDISEDGSLVAVTTSLPVTEQGNRGRIYLFEWGAQAVATPKLLSTSQAGAAIAVSPDGLSVAAVAGDDHVRLRRDGSNVTDSGFPGIGNDVAVSASARHLSVAGSADGWIVLYSDDTAKDVRDLRVRDESNPLTSVDIRRDATALAAGNSQGDVWVYAVDAAIPFISRLIGTTTLSGSVVEVAFSRDGATLAAITTATVAHFAVRSTGLALLWEQPRTGGHVGLGLDEGSELVGVAAGSEALLYDARHSATLGTAAAQSGAPGTAGNVTLVVSNSGNRLETISLQLESPSSWAATVVPSSVTLAPNQTESIEVRWSVPAFESPGVRDLKVRASLVGRTAPSSESIVQVSVPEARAWDLAASGPLALGVRAGQPTAFTSTLTNGGNVATVPPLSVRVDDATWTARLVGANGTVAPGQAAAIILELTAPANSPELAHAKATLSVTGFPGETLTFTGTVGASFGVGLEAPPGVEVVAGSEKQVTLTARNTGNALDGLRLQIGTLPAGWSARFLDGRTLYEAPQVSPGSSVQATLIVAAPADAPATPILVTVTAQSLADPSKEAQRTFLASAVQPATSQTDTGTDQGSKDSPGPGVPALLGLVAALAVVFRRPQTKGP